MAAGHGVPKVLWEVALTTDPYTRPGPGDWTPATDLLPPQELTTVRGAPIRTPGIETGTMTLVVADQDRILDDTNTSSPWAGGWDVRRRVRAIIDQDDGAPTTTFTGFVERTTRSWSRQVSTTTIVAADLFSVIAGSKLPISASDAVTRRLDPVAHWPMSETSGRFAGEVIGGRHGTYVLPVQNSGPVIPYDPRTGPKFGRPSGPAHVSQAMVVESIEMAEAVSFVISFKWDPTVEVDMFPTLMMVQDSSHPMTFSASVGTASIFMFVRRDATSPNRSQSIAITIQDASGFNEKVHLSDMNVLDGQFHQMVFTIDGATKDVLGYLDGVHCLMVDLPVDAVSPISDIDVAGVLASARLFAAGWGIKWDSPQATQNAAWVQAASYFDRILNPTEIAELWEAGAHAWDGDRTDERANRILDLVGVDPGDRDLSAGTQYCGPAMLNNENALTYLRKVAQTEGGAVFVNPDGQVALRPLTPNHPTSVLIISDAPSIDGPGAVPYSGSLTAEAAIDRVVNVARVSRPGADPKEVIQQASKDRYGERSTEIDILSGTPAGASIAGTRLIALNNKPRQVFEQFTLEGRDGGVGFAAVMETELGDAVTLIARPPGGGDPMTELCILERIEQHLYPSKKWTTTCNASQHLELPDFTWDESGAGWDESMWVP